MEDESAVHQPQAKEQLGNELAELRQRVAELEAKEAEREQMEKVRAVPSPSGCGVSHNAGIAGCSAVTGIGVFGQSVDLIQYRQRLWRFFRAIKFPSVPKYSHSGVACASSIAVA